MPDTDLTLEQMRTVAFKSFGEPVPTTPPDEAVEEPTEKTEEVKDTPKRDAAGKFAPKMYRREFDDGSGAGKYVYEAATEAELADKLLTAQQNATKLIREQKSKLKEFEEAQKQKIDAEQQAHDDIDRDFNLSQELLTHPTDAIKKQFKEMTGYEPQEFKSVAERLRAYEAAQAATQDEITKEEASQSFLTAHPEYVPTPRNGKLLVRAVEQLKQQRAASGANFDYQTLLSEAYTDLSTDELLDTESDATQTQTGANRRIGTGATEAEPATRQPIPRRSSSLTSRPSSTQGETKTLAADDLTKLSDAELRKLAWADPSLSFHN